MEHFESLVIDEDGTKIVVDTEDLEVENAEQLETVSEEDASSIDQEFPVTVILLCTEADAKAVQAFLNEFPEIMPMDDFGNENKSLVWFSGALKNAKRKGVITNESGLQYEILAKGGEEKYVAPADGKSPNKIFMVNYKGTMLDGTEFDASAPGKPVKMSLDVVDGLREALTSMPVGAKWKLYLPSAMAYGERRASVDIGPNTTLIFELELVEIKDAPPEVQMPFEGLQIPPGQ
jgi:FKBP-type peptidyl-prolyl cis-trans isomerase